MAELDYETTVGYELTIRASDIVTGSIADTTVHIAVQVFFAFWISYSETVFRVSAWLGSASEMTYIVSGGALNSTHCLSL